MDYTEYAEYCRLIGYRVEETPRGVWIGKSHGFLNRVPLYETTPPSEGELRSLFRRYPILGVHYAADSSRQGEASHNYFVRDQDYNFENLQPRVRRKTRGGLRECQVRPMSYIAWACH